MPTLPQGRLWVLSSSLIFSCVVLGISISLLRAERTTVYLYKDVSAPPGTDWPQPQPQPQRRNPGHFTVDADDFHISEILATVSSALNLLLAAALLVTSAMKRKTIISAVAVEAPCIYVVSFMWLASAAYAEHLSDGNPGSLPFIDATDCTRHKVLEAFAFINWIQLMLYANTLMTVATICHVRRHSVWFLPVTELPTLGAPALTFESGPDAFDSPFIVKTDESETPILGVSRPNVNSRAPSHFRSRLTFPQHPTHQPRILSTIRSPLPTSESVESLAPSMSTQDDVISSQNPTSYPRLCVYHRIGEPPTYSGPSAGYEPEAM